MTIIEGSSRPISIIAGKSHPELAKAIADYIGVPLTESGSTQFSCGELFSVLGDSVRGHSVYIIQTAGPNVNQDMMELFILLDAARRASAAHINVIMPHYGYARQDKKADSREPITAKLMANLMVTSGATRMISMDLHADQIQGYFDIPMDHLIGLPLFVDYFKDLKLKDLVVAAPDAGRAKAAKKFADKIGAELAIIHKSRPKHNVSEVQNVVGDVKGKNVLLYDDMVDTGGSVVNAKQALIDNGANPDIYLVATHAVFSGPAVDRLNGAGFKEIVVTDTIPTPKIKGLKVLSTAQLFGEAIKRCHTHHSISELFRKLD